MVHNLSQNCHNDEQDTNLKEYGLFYEAIAVKNYVSFALAKAIAILTKHPTVKPKKALTDL
jgi:hypothetical protein